MPGLQICVQNCLDVATHLAAAAGRDVADYATAIDRLAELGVLPDDFARRFRAVAGFRDVLVHGYLDVDAALVHRILNERLDEFEVFARTSRPFLRRAERASRSTGGTTVYLTPMPLSWPSERVVVAGGAGFLDSYLEALRAGPVPDP